MTTDEEIVEYAIDVVKMFGIGKVVERSEIVREVNLKYGRTVGSIIPSDYCYNIINNGIKPNKPTLFIYNGKGQYECVGLNYPYNGVIWHRPKGAKAEFPVGKCVNGERIIAPNSNLDVMDSTSALGVKKIEKSSTHKTSRTPSIKLRFDVLKRDMFKCCICGASPAKDASIELHLDHIIPWSKGGETEINNLQSLCSRCNLGKSDSV
ncbi:HNH endonuclease [Paenibacillus sp. yr247]|uniref:DUF7225 domain-containing protein n=1 Tax=Paenibacillus sp. yr247 TaxID=1761880 RepID=UPI00087FD0AB|nr:HNH endonuclease [Paenibacillus sp. yr247]SDN61130.1 HNH endonuclease [Paenibacillus sp. yr247]